MVNVINKTHHTNPCCNENASLEQFLSEGPFAYFQMCFLFHDFKLNALFHEVSIRKAFCDKHRYIIIICYAKCVNIFYLPVATIVVC